MTYASRLDLAAKVRSAILPILQARLSDTLDLQARLKAAHWNVKGPQFGALHVLFDQMATEVAEASDDLAERLVTLGGHADGRPATTAQGSSLPAWPLVTQAEKVLTALAEATATHGRALRAAIDEAAAMGDAGTADLFTGQSRLTDKHLWQIEAHLLAGQAI